MMVYRATDPQRLLANNFFIYDEDYQVFSNPQSYEEQYIYGTILQVK